MKKIILLISCLITLNATSTWQEVSSTSAITMAQTIHSAPSKVSPQDSDEIGIADSNASYLFKKISIGSLKTFLFGSPALTGIPTAPTASNGTNTNQIATTSYVLSNGGSGLGVGQTWQNVTASRVAGTTYTNNTGKPIMINIFIDSSIGTYTLYVGGIMVDSIYRDVVYQSSLKTIVPNGSTYLLTAPYPIANWAELR